MSRRRARPPAPRRTRLLALAGPRRPRNTALVLIVVVAVAALALRLPATLATVLILGILAVALVVRAIGVREAFWEPRREEAGHAGWVGVAMLSHGIAVADSSPWEFDRTIEPRLTRLAGAALTRDGVDWGSDRAREILGPEVHDALRPDPGRSGRPAGWTRTALTAAALAALERHEAASGRDPR